MTIELANRLVEFRKKFGYSQEELGNRLNVSRQSISNWESGEVTPSIDYLKELAKIYGVSLDDLVNCDKTVDEVLNKDKSKKEEADDKNDFTVNDGKSYVNISKDGIHILDEDGSSVDIDNKGIKVNDNSDAKSNSFDYGVKLDNNLKAHFNYISKKKKRERIAEKVNSIVTGVFALLVLAAYLTLGFLVNGAWGVYWTLFILIPVPGLLMMAIIKRKFCVVPIPLMVTFAYLFMGVKFSMWHPWWLLFLIIPVYYSVFGPIDKAIFEHGLNKEKEDSVITINGDSIKVKNNIEDKLTKLEEKFSEIDVEISTILKTMEKCKESKDRDLIDDFKDDLLDKLGDIEEKIDYIEDLFDEIEDSSDLPIDIRFKYKAEIKNAKNKVKNAKDMIDSI